MPVGPTAASVRQAFAWMVSAAARTAAARATPRWLTRGLSTWAFRWWSWAALPWYGLLGPIPARPGHPDRRSPWHASVTTSCISRPRSIPPSCDWERPRRFRPKSCRTRRRPALEWHERRAQRLAFDSGLRHRLRALERRLLPRGGWNMGRTRGWQPDRHRQPDRRRALELLLQGPRHHLVHHLRGRCLWQGRPRRQLTSGIRASGHPADGPGPVRTAEGGYRSAGDPARRKKTVNLRWSGCLRMCYVASAFAPLHLSTSA